MNYKKLFVIISILFIIGFPVYATPENKYVPKTEIFIQPIDGKRYNINEYKALEIGKKYQFQITSYIMKTTKNKLFGIQINESINAGISFDAPIIIDVTDYPSNVAVDRKYNYTTYIYSAPIFRSTPKSDETSRVQININFTPIKAGKQKITLLYANDIDPRFWKDWYLTVEGTGDSSNNTPNTPSFSPQNTNTTNSPSYSSSNSPSSTTTPEANYNLGNKYYAGGGYEKAVHYYELAANEEHADAQYRLGICFENGHGVQQDLKKAEYWFEKAVKNGSSTAKVHLSELNNKYNKKNSQNSNNTSSQEIATMVSNNSSSSSYSRTTELNALQGDGYFSIGNYEKAVEYYELAANEGHANAQYRLSICYEQGYGVQKNPNMANEWLEKAVQNGSSPAIIHLSEIKNKQKDTSLPSSPPIQQSNDVIVTQQQSPEELFNLGNSYYKQNDYEKALYYFEQAANRGYAEAQYQLGIGYEWGNWLPKDRDKAIYWLSLAVQNNHLAARDHLARLDSDEYFKSIRYEEKTKEN